jgi:hypothetical protein
VRKIDPNFCSKIQCERDLVAAGFSLTRANRTSNSEDIKFTFCDQWIQITSRSSLNIPDPLNALMGEPGLWKIVTEKDGQPRKIFEFPIAMVAENNPECGLSIKAAKPSLTRALGWARRTLVGERTNDWRSPPKQELLKLLDPQSLTTHSSLHARQGELVCQPNRLALRFPILFNVPNDLPQTHYFWLRNLLIDAQNRWKMVRVGFRNESSATSVQAEVDLSGVPHSVLEDLLTVALAALQALVAWVVPSAEFLVKQASGIWALSLHDDLEIECGKQKKGGD